MFMDQSALNFFYLTFKGTFSNEIGCLSETRFFGTVMHWGIFSF